MGKHGKIRGMRPVSECFIPRKASICASGETAAEAGVTNLTERGARATQTAFALAALLASAWIAAPLTAHADPILHGLRDYRETAKSFSLTPEFSYYSTKGNYLATGTSVTPSGFQDYARFETDLHLAYGLLENLTVFSRLAWARIDIASINTQHPAANAFGPPDQAFGANFRLLDFLDLQAQVELPPYDNHSSETAGTPFLGDGSMDIQGSLFFHRPIWKGHIAQLTGEVAGGIVKRSEGFPTAVPWLASVRYSPFKTGVFGNLSFRGLHSLGDNTTAAAAALPSVSSGAGGTFLVNSPSPSLITFEGHLGYRFSEKMELYASGSQSVWGKLAPMGFSGGVGLVARFPGGPNTKSPEDMTPEEYGRANKGFVRYDLEAKVLKTNDRLNLIRINKGEEDGIQVGQEFDIFEKTSKQAAEPIARAKVTSVKFNEAVLTVTEYYEEVWIEENFVAKRSVQ